MPTCCDCGLNYPKNIFAKSQLKKPADRRRCLGCAAEAEDAKAGATCVTAGGGTSSGGGTAANNEASPPLDDLRSGVSLLSVSGNVLIPKSTLEFLKDLHDAGRMTSTEYEAAKQTLYNATQQQHDVFIAKWKPFGHVLPCRGKLRNLKSRPELNGREGTASAWLAESKRYQVRLSKTNNTIAVKPENFVPTNGRFCSNEIVGRCWDGNGWGKGYLRCDGRIPLNGGVNYIMDGPYPATSSDEDENQHHFDRKAVVCVFTFSGHMHVLQSPKLGGTSMLVETDMVEIEHNLIVDCAFPVSDGKRLLITAENPELWPEDMANFSGGQYCLFLCNYPMMDIVKIWEKEDGEEFEQKISLIDFHEDLLAVIFAVEDENEEDDSYFDNSRDSQLCCYSYSDSASESFLTKVASWDFPEDVDGPNSTCDMTVKCGGICGEVVTLNYNGLVRVWKIDSPAGCTLILNGSLDNLGPPVGGLPRSQSKPGSIRRVPHKMQEQVARQLKIDSDFGVVTFHNGTLSFWETCMNEFHTPCRAFAIHNPLVTSGSDNEGLVMDSELTGGVLLHIGDGSDKDENAEEPGHTQISIFNPFREAVTIGFEVDKDFGLVSEAITFCGGRLLIAGDTVDEVGSLYDLGSTSPLQSHKHGNETSYVYIVSAREEDTRLSFATGKNADLGIVSKNVPGLLQGLHMTSHEDAWEFREGNFLNVTLAIPHMGMEGPPVKPPEIRPCCFLCNGCGALSCLAELNSCTGCESAFYCSRKCQKKAWPMHKASCKALQGVREWIKKQGLTRSQVFRSNR